jgi:predicted transcriptional regulator
VLQYDQDNQRTKADRVTLTIRVQPDLHEAIERLATTQGETISTVARQILRQGIQQRQAVTP